MDVEKRIHELRDRLRYIRDIFGEKENENIVLLESKLGEYLFKERDLPAAEQERRLTALEDLFGFVEKKLERTLTPMDRVRIVRHPQRICLGDILENVYDNFTEIGGQDEYSIDPSVVIARAYITRRVGKKRYHQPVMVIGQEKGHGQEFRNGGSVKPWGNAKALHYMQVAETENIPIHTYVFTPGAYPIEDYPGAAQQIAKNLYEMSGLTVPVVAVFSEGGSGGAEAIALADCRLMLSHGYYSVISPEGAAAIESRIRQGERVPPESIEKCARKLCITGQENLRFGYVERIVPEPPLGARPGHYDFFKLLRQEVIRATDEIVLDVGGIKLFRAMALRRRKSRATSLPDGEGIYVRWSLSATAREKLLSRRYKKYMRLAQHAFLDRRPLFNKAYAWANDLGWALYSYVKYDFWGKHQKKIVHAMEEMGAEVSLVRDRVSKPIKRFFWDHLPAIRTSPGRRGDLTQLSSLEDRIVPRP